MTTCSYAATVTGLPALSAYSYGMPPTQLPITYTIAGWPEAISCLIYSIVEVRLNPKSPTLYIILVAHESFVSMEYDPFFSLMQSVFDCNKKEITHNFEATFEAYLLI